MKKSFIFTLLFCVMLTSICFAKDINSHVPKTLQNQAQKFLKEVQEMISEDIDLAGWGFNNKEELNNLKLGVAFKVKDLDIENLKDYKGTSILEVSKSTEDWQYILYSNNIPKVVMTIGVNDGKYELESFSGSAEADDYNTAFKQYQNYIKSNPNKLNNRPIIVRAGEESILLIENGYEELTILITPYKYQEYQVKANTVKTNAFQPAKKILKLQKEKNFGDK